MSVLEGLAGFGMGVAGAGAAISARDKRDRAERQLVLNEQQGARLATQERERLDVDAANQNAQQLDRAGLLTDAKDKIDGARAAALLEANDSVALDAMKNVARTSGLIDPSVKDIRFVKGPKGDWVIQTSNEDGSFGVITLDGSSDPDSPVASFKTLEDFVKVANRAYGRSANIQTVFDSSRARAARDMVDVDFSNTDSLAASMPANQAVAFNRGVYAGLANIEDPAEQQEFLDRVAPPETPRGPSQNNSGISRAARESRGRQVDAPEMTPARRKAKESELERAKEKRDRLTEKGGKSMNARSQLAGAERAVSALEKELGVQVPSAFVMETPDQQVSADKVVDDTQDLPTEQVVEKVESGEIEVSPEVQQQVGAQLQAAGVETIADLRNLESDRDRAMARVAMIAAFKGDETTQRAMIAQMSNIFETGTASVSADGATKARIQQQNANTSLSRLLFDIKNKDAANRVSAAEIGSTLVQDLDNYRNEDGSLDPRGIEQFMPALTEFFVEAGALERDDAAYAYQALKPVASQILAAYAAQEEGGVSETLVSFFRGDATGSNITTTDFNLDRVDGAFNSKGELIGFKYLDANGRTLDEMVDPAIIENLDPNIYRLLELAVIAKVQARTGG